MLERARPDGRVPAGHHRPRGRAGRAARDDRPLRADGRPRRHPRRAAGAQRPADQGVAGRQGRLRLEVRDAVLAVDQGLRPADRPGACSSRRAATWPASGRATTTPAACTRRRPTRSSAARSRSSCRLTKGEHDQLNPSGINCIRAFPGRGIRVWGARTISSDPAWRYLNVRRLFNFVEESILEGTQWVVFEPNDLRLWGRVKRDDQRVPAPGLARRRAVRRDARPGVLRQVRRGEQPARGPSTPAS